jgi:2-iminobutanoate/2-iminopropanoate deaminase
MARSRRLRRCGTPRRDGLLRPSLLLQLALLAAAAASPHPAAAQDGTVVRRLEAGALAAYSTAVQVGGTIWLSGTLGVADGALVAGGIQAETRQALVNIGSTLAELGASLDDVVKCTVYLADIGEWGAMNEVYATFFPRRRPARSSVGVAGLPLDARIELACVAMVGAGGGGGEDADGRPRR